MKKLIIIAGCLILASCTANKVQPLGDSIEYAQYEGTPLPNVEDLEPVYIPTDLLGLHQPGDTCLADSNGVLVEMPLRDAETRQPILTGLHRVVLGLRLEHNTRAKINECPKFIDND